MARIDNFSACVDSVLDHAYESLEIVNLVNGNQSVFDRLSEDYGDLNGSVFQFNE